MKTKICICVLVMLLLIGCSKEDPSKADLKICNISLNQCTYDRDSCNQEKTQYAVNYNTIVASTKTLEADKKKEADNAKLYYSNWQNVTDKFNRCKDELKESLTNTTICSTYINRIKHLEDQLDSNYSNCDNDTLTDALDDCNERLDNIRDELED